MHICNEVVDQTATKVQWASWQLTQEALGPNATPWMHLVLGKSADRAEVEAEPSPLSMLSVYLLPMVKPETSW